MISRTISGIDGRRTGRASGTSNRKVRKSNFEPERGEKGEGSPHGELGGGDAYSLLRKLIPHDGGGKKHLYFTESVDSFGSIRDRNMGKKAPYAVKRTHSLINIS